MVRSIITQRLILAALEDRITPNTYVVNALTDTFTGSGLSGDLRYCINQANLSMGADQIDASGITGTIALNSQLPAITDDLILFGPGADLLEINGGGSTRLMLVNGSGSTQVDFSDLTFTQGATMGNGGVANISNAKVSFLNCILSNSSSNQGGALAGSSSTSITIIDCTLSGNSGTTGGGAIYSAGTLAVKASTMSANRTGMGGSGGAIVLLGSSVATISNSTLSGNTADAHGGAIRTSAAFTGSLHVKATTITQNLVQSGSGTGRGISQGGGGGSIKIDGSIVSQNFGGAGSTSDVNGAILGSYSLFGTTDSAMITGNGNFKGTNMSPVDAKLGPLADNGGPTLTHMPMNDSPVREAGVDPDVNTYDQRGPGYARTENYATDMGAVETLNFKPMAANIDVVVDEASPAATFQFTVTYFDPRGSELIDYSSLGTGDLYIPGPNGYLETPTFISASPGADAQTIVATYEIPVPINGQAGWDISDNGVYALIALPNEVFDKDTPTANAGDTVAFAFLRVEIPAVYTVDDMSDVVDMNYAPGELSLREAILLSNSDNQFSRINFDAAVFNSATTITLDGSELAVNDALTIDGPAAPLTIDGDAKSRIFNTSGAGAKSNIEINHLTLTNGRYDVYGPLGGGGIYVDDENLVLDHVTVSNCYGKYRGGGIFVHAQGTPNVVTLRDCVITGNTGEYFGGGIHFSYAGDLNLIRCTISNNVGGATGGALDLYEPRQVTIVDSAITGNQAGPLTGSTRGGGIYFRTFIGSATSSLAIINSTISSNKAIGADGKGVGGGISSQNGTNGLLSIINSTLTGNTAGSDGGGLRIVYGYVDLQSSIVAGNTSADQRDIYGMQYVGRGPLTISASHSLIGVGNTGKMTLQPGNMTGTMASPLDAKLGPLADNGGPTKSHALLPGSPCINAGSNVNGMMDDQRGPGYVRVSGPAADIGAYELQQVKVSAVVINGGDKQRSRVTKIDVTFDQDIDLPADPADAFQLIRQSDNAVVGVSATQTGHTVTLTFTGGAVDGNVGNHSLADGRYTLTILANQVNLGGLDGNGNGIPGDDYVLASDPAPSPPTNIFRIFGDVTGDGSVAVNDFIVFRQNFNGYLFALDFDGDGAVANSDFVQFRLRFNGSI